MKIKIILIPLIIIFAIIFGVWFIYPAYSNGVDGVRDKYKQLGEEQTKLSGIQGKSGNATRLFSQIVSLPDSADVLSEFMPKEIKNEEIISALNQLASSSGLVVSEIFIKNSEQNNPGLSSVALETNPDPTASPSDAPVFPLPKMQELETEMSFNGNYEQIKNFLNSLNKLSRYNTISYFSVKKNTPSDLATDSGLLEVDLKINFGFLKEVVLSSDTANNSVFSDAKLNTNIISEIKNKRSANVNKLGIGQKGKANIFMP